MKTRHVDRPDWLTIHFDGDPTYRGGHWAGLTIYDEDSSWYCFRNDGPGTKEEYFNSIKFVNDSMNLQPLNAWKAAMMLAVFAEEEENL